MSEQLSEERVPVTILTGFLGSGKTTLLNHILSEQHGKRIAVIENEYGELNIDHALVINVDEEIYEMSNGCICCTVRGDLIRILGNLSKRRDRFDYILIETTGLADPGPVAQTFIMDEELRQQYRLDGIVTVVDAHHVAQQLGRSHECEEQIAFADVILLNKIDLVEPQALDALEARVRKINAVARVHRTRQAQLDVSKLLQLRAFDLDAMLTRRPDFLEPEYPFEWTGVYDLAPGLYTLALGPGPDPQMSLAWISLESASDEALHAGAERVVRLFAHEALRAEPAAASALPLERHVELALQAPGLRRFGVLVERAGLYGLYAQHHASEFELRVLGPHEAALPLVRERVWVAEHEHDDEVSSVSIDRLGDVDPERLNAWLSGLLRDRGPDLFRLKGVLSVAGFDARLVFQGVHMLLDSQPDRPWGAQARRNQLVFIGRDLDAEALRRGFDACLI